LVGGIVGDVGDDVSVEEAFRKWADDLTRYATALVGPAEAADLVAESFATVLALGDRRWAQVREPRGYLFRAVSNQARMMRRSRVRRERRELAWTAEPVRGELLADPAVRGALDQLRVQQRAMMFLTYWEDMSPAQIAALLDVSEGAVKRQLARARSTMRKVLA
jgi:RNA polymerase sigma-70 factor (ECF subfamily)